MARAARKPTPANDTPPPAPGHNGLTDDQHEVLFFINRRDWFEAMAAKKAADAKVKLVGKTIKADLGPNGLDEIKTYEKAQTEEGAAEIKAKMESTRRAMNLAGIPIGTQLDLLVDRAPLDERAYKQGREAGLKGDSLSNPYNESTAEGDAYARGWREGQDAILAATKARMEAANAAANPPAELVEGAGHDGDLDDEDRD